MKSGTSAPSRLCLDYRSRFDLARCAHSGAASTGRTSLSGVYSRAKVGQSFLFPACLALLFSSTAQAPTGPYIYVR